MPGRPPIPIAIHKARGTYRKERHAEKFQAKTGGIGPPPEWMTGEALDEWRRLTEDAEYGAVLGRIHRGTLVEYCVLYTRMIEDATDKKPMSGRDRQNLNSIRMQLGITPASQCKLRAPEQKAHENQWAALRG